MPGLAEQCDLRQSLKKLADAIPWKTFEDAFASLYSSTGRPAKPIRLMVGLLLLKQLENLSDEVVVQRKRLINPIVPIWVEGHIFSENK